MLVVALKGLAGRKLRAALTALAIVLGVAMVSGTYVLTDTIDRAFDNIFDRSYAGTSAVVSGRSPDISFQGDQADTPAIDARLLDKVRSVPEVESATGIVADESATKILNRKGKAIDTHGAPSFGFGIDTSPALQRFNPLELLEGRWARSRHEVVIDAGTADDQGYEIGDAVGIASLHPVERFEVVGIAQYGGVDSIGTATFAVFTTPTAQELLDRKGKLDAISAAARDGVSDERLVRELRGALPQSVEVRTGTAEAADQSKEVSEFTKFIRYFLLAFGTIALFVGAFVIFNTLSITVAQRTREFATMRTIGASRGQVLGSVIIEALVVGVLASVTGLFLGLGLAKGINSLFVALGLDLPTTGLVFAPRTVVVSLIVGVVVTLVAGLSPAVRATRVPPIAAVREGAVLPRSRLAPIMPYVAALFLVVSLTLLVWALFADEVGTGERLAAIGLGTLGLFAGVAMISARLVRPLAKIVGWPAARFGGAPGKLAQGNAFRNPGRTAATAAALMIGLALVTFVAVLSQGMKASNRKAIEDQVIADYVVTSQSGFEPFVAGAGKAVARAPEAQLVTDVRSDLAKLGGSSKYLTGIDPKTITAAYHFDWKDGSDAVLGSLGRNGTIVDKDFANDKHLKLGSRLRLLVPGGKHMQLIVRGIYEPPPFYPLLGNASVDKRTFDRLYDRPRNQFTFVNVAGDPNEAASKRLEAALVSFPDAKVQTRAEWITEQDKDFNRFLLMLYVLLALSVIVSLFGMINTLVLSVVERTREIGMLRAVAATRWQTRWMIANESVITALIGAALGLPLGIFLAALVTRALSQFDVRFELPVGLLVTFTVVAVVAGILSAIFPARRAARLRILSALQYE